MWLRCLAPRRNGATRTMVGILSAAALLLVVAGLAKLRDPGPARSAIVAARLPGGARVRSPWVARSVGAAEVLVGTAALLVGGRWTAALLGASYLLLALVAWRLLSVASGTGCGCFGATGAPISRWHLALDLGFAAACCRRGRVPHPGAAPRGVVDRLGGRPPGRPRRPARLRRLPDDHRAAEPRGRRPGEDVIGDLDRAGADRRGGGPVRARRGAAARLRRRAASSARARRRRRGRTGRRGRTRPRSRSPTR